MNEVWVTRGQTRLFAVELGEGPALVFVHGGLADHRAALPVVHDLSDRFRLILPDLRGSGRSWAGEELFFADYTSDLLCLLDHLDIERAFVGGMSSGSGPALHFGLNHPERALGLVLVHPVYAGASVGYSSSQREAFARMDAVASRARAEGIDVMRDLYFDELPASIAERAWAMASTFDADSVTATSRFIASGRQPFEDRAALERVGVPTLIVGADDPVHPLSVTELYSNAIPGASLVDPGTADIAGEIRAFLNAHGGS